MLLLHTSQLLRSSQLDLETTTSDEEDPEQEPVAQQTDPLPVPLLNNLPLEKPQELDLKVKGTVVVHLWWLLPCEEFLPFCLDWLSLVDRVSSRLLRRVSRSFAVTYQWMLRKAPLG